MSGCKECYRRERRRLGLCLKCDEPVFINLAGKLASHCEEHKQIAVRKAKKTPPVKKHVLSLEDFRKAKKMLAAESPVPNEIAKHFGVSRRTIDRVAKGEYDNYFKGVAMRNAAAVSVVNS